MILGNFVKMWEHDDTSCCVIESDCYSIDAAVSQWLDTRRDSLLHLTLLNGDAYVTKASNVVSWRKVTLNGRRLDIEYQAARTEEEKAFKAEMGLPSWEDSD